MSSAVKVIETPVEVRGELNPAGGDQHHHVTSMGRNMAPCPNRFVSILRSPAGCFH